jgi:hypothetical protein
MYNSMAIHKPYRNGVQEILLAVLERLHNLVRRDSLGDPLREAAEMFYDI